MIDEEMMKIILISCLNGILVHTIIITNIINKYGYIVAITL